MAVNIYKKGLTLRWKIVLIYCTLVFIAIAIIGVFIMGSLERYYINSVRGNLTNTVQGGILISLGNYQDLAGSSTEIQSNVNAAWARTIQEELFVIDSNMKVVASNMENEGRGVIGTLDSDVILKALVLGEAAESTGTITGQDASIPIMNLAFPVRHSDAVTGVVYVRADMTGIHDTIDQSKQIFVNAMLLALVVTIIMGFLISKTITVPIKEVTQKAAGMAKGDFSQEVSVKSGDEIGQLAWMFNELRAQLSNTLLQMSSEKSKLETILRYMADGLVAIDVSGRIIHANQTAMRILKVEADDLENKLYDEIIKDLKEDLALKELAEKCESGVAAETFSAGGSTYAVRYDRFKDEKGSDIGIIMIIQDITERQKMEDMQTDFVANVSHELKTPLTTIKSYTETLLDGPALSDETAKSFLSIIDSEADRMNRLVKDLLHLSRLDHKQEKWFKKEINLIPLLRTCVKNIEFSAKTENRHLNSIFNPGDDIRVVVDKDRIEQVILNILSNAIKYTKSGGRIDIDAFASGRKAHIVITDNGIGIPESEISRVFERFFRVDKARSRAMGGTGLGLAISKQIVEEHGGSIELQSREGRGTKVTVLLPAAPMRGERGID
ncbi:MAG: cell wall metabolism sensor histidine kinase WalK [Clostridiales bacterium]|nr:cell wall metabolism sensor histidine kinase WalK [Clostridiales bacterium]